MIEALREKLEQARREYPILGKFLDGSIKRADLEAVEEACRAAGLVDIAEGVRVVRTDPEGFRKVAHAAITQTETGQELIAEIQELAPSVMEGISLMRRAEAFLEALKR